MSSYPRKSAHRVLAWRVGWMLAAALALPAAQYFLAQLPPFFAYNPVSRGFLFGLCLAAPQAWLLCRRIPSPARWVATSMLGWVVGLALQGALFLAAPYVFGKPNTATLLGDAGLGWKFYLACEWGIPGLCIGLLQARQWRRLPRTWPALMALAFALAGASIPGTGLFLARMFPIAGVTAATLALAAAGLVLGIFTVLWLPG